MSIIPRIDLAILFIVGIFGLPLLGLGVRSMFKPRAMTEPLSVQPEGPAGLNTIRGVVGGFFLGSAAMIAVGLVMNETLWFLAVAILMGAAALGRIIGLVLGDGFDRTIMRALVIEVVMGVVLVVAHFRLEGSF